LPAASRTATYRLSMSSRRRDPEHEEAVSRRLALLSAELAGSRPEGEDWSSTWPPASQSPELSPEPSFEPSFESAPASPVAPTAPDAPAVPVPGRHSSRRAPGALRDLVPDTLRGRVSLGPAQLVVVTLVVAAGLAATCWWVVRGDAERLQAPPRSPIAISPSTAGALADAPPVAADASGGASPGADAVDAPGSVGSPGAGPATVTVDVAGKVRKPGIAVLDAGARVVDALEAAGGARPGVVLTGLNLARVLVDGEQIVVGPQPPGLAAAAVPDPTASAPAGPLVDLNTATQAQLEALPEVGPVTAQAILAWREGHGGFTTVDELLEVDGIGDATLEQLTPYVTV
jgi:competence protein ComEA